MTARPAIACRIFALLLGLSTVIAQDLGRAIGLPLLISVPTPPTAVRANGGFLLVYELHLTNAGSKSISLLNVDVRGPSGRVATLETGELEKAMKPTGDSGQRLTLAPGSHSVVLQWLLLDHAPATLEHIITGRYGDEELPLVVLRGGTPVGTEVLRLGPPVRGDRWGAANGPSNDTHHRRSWLPHGGRALVPERFAIDFVRLSPEGGLTTGDPAENRSYPGYGEEVLAVADARVASVMDGIPDNAPANRAPSAPTVETMNGNYVILELGAGRFALYSHLQPGSLPVKPGERVRRGAVLGQLGNSGNANGPHLHFQISDGPQPLFSDGLPYVFETFFHDEVRRENEIPLNQWVIRFPEF